MPSKYYVADELVSQLGNIGIKQIYGITGDVLNTFLDAIRRQDKIQWITVRHEESAGFAAAAEAELTGKLAVCAGTVGPGALHLINGLYNAKRNYAPVLMISGTVPQAEEYGPYFQEIDMHKVFDDLCVFNAGVQSTKQLPRLLQQAINAAIQHRGVANISIPADLMLEKMEPGHPIFISQHKEAVTAEESEITQLADLINQAKSVAMLVGWGCINAKQQLIKLSEKLQAPVANSLKGGNVFDFNHPNHIGGIGHVGTPHGLKVIDDCDLLLMLGTDFPYSAFLPKSGKIVQIDINPEHLGRRCPIKLGIAGDVGMVINQLLPKINDKQNKDLPGLQQSRDKWLEKTNHQYGIKSLEKSKVIHPQSIFCALTELANDDAIFVCDVGEITVWAARYLRLRGEQKLISSFSHGSLGIGLPAAIGAQFAYPGRQVIALSGDGGFGMLLCDLITLTRYNLPITQIVVNNEKFGFIELEMEAAGLPRYATDLVNPDFAAVARACNMEGYTVKDPKDLVATLEKTIHSNKPCLLDVFVNPTELIIPSKMEYHTALKYMQGKIREMLIEKDIKVLFEK